MAINYELINKGGISLGTNFELLSEKPLDSRLVVPSLDGLQNYIDSAAAYEGMIAYVTSEKKHYEVKVIDGVLSYRPFGLTETELNDLITNATTAAMEFKGATATLPENPAKGDMYKVAGENINIKIDDVDAKLGDSIVYDGEKWFLIPSGDDIEDTWRPVDGVNNDATLKFVDGDKTVAVVAADGTIKYNHATVAAPEDVTAEGDEKTRTYITAVETDGYGHITGYKTATENVEDTNTEYTFESQVESSSVYFNVTPNTEGATEETIYVDAYSKNEANNKFKVKRAEALAAAETDTNVFIDTVAQDVDGNITITTKAVDFSAITERLGNLEEIDHTHDNKDILDGITDTRVDAWDEAEKNVIASVDTAQFNIDADRKLALLDVAQSKISGLTNKAGEADTLANVLAEKVDKVEGSRLITSDEASKLEKLVLGDNGEVTVSGKVAAGNVDGLDTWITSRAGTLEGLSENNFTDALLNKLSGIEADADVNIIESVKVNGTALTVTDKAVDISIPTGALAGKDKVAKTDLADALATEIDNKVTKENNKSLIADSEITRLSGMSDGANKVEASTNNGYIKIDGNETVVYSHPNKHAITDVDGLQEALNGLQAKGDYAAEEHTHTKDEITDFAHTHTKSEITDFAHAHTASEITDFATEVAKVKVTNAGQADSATNATDATHADAATKVDNALTVKVGGADVVFDGSAVKTADVDAAIEAAINAIPAQTDYSVTITENTDDNTVAKTYVFSQCGAEIGSIKLAKELVVTSGSVKEVTIADAPYAGAVVGDKYIELVIANQSTPIYVPAKDLVDIYTAKDMTGIEGAEIQVAISNTNEISATLVNGGITEEKLAEGVKTKLNKTWEEVGIAAGLVEGLENGQVKANKEAIEKLNGADTVDGSVAKSIKEAIAGENLGQYAKTADLGDLATLDTITADKVTDFATEVAKVKVNDAAKADEATKATQDGNGKVIADTYAEKATTLDGYGIGDAYTKTEVEALLTWGSF